MLGEEAERHEEDHGVPRAPYLPPQQPDSDSLRWASSETRTTAQPPLPQPQRGQHWKPPPMAPAPQPPPPSLSAYPSSAPTSLTQEAVESPPLQATTEPSIAAAPSEAAPSAAQEAEPDAPSTPAEEQEVQQPEDVTTGAEDPESVEDIMAEVARLEEQGRLVEASALMAKGMGRR
jgi:hypothetical protein